MTTDTKAERSPEHRTIELAHSSYQPSKAELEEGLRVDARGSNRPPE